MEKNEKSVNATENVTENATETENFLDSFNSDEEEIMDLSTEKLDELNKKLPNWSIEPPHKFLNK